MANILLIEDDADSAEPIALILRKRFHKVEVADHGESALNLLLFGCSPDVILMDLQMPVMDGISFLDNLRSMEQFRALPVVVISALSPWAMQELEPYHVTAVLTKGYVDLLALADSIDELDRMQTARC